VLARASFRNEEEAREYSSFSPFVIEPGKIKTVSYKRKMDIIRAELKAVDNKNGELHIYTCIEFAIVVPGRPITITARKMIARTDLAQSGEELRLETGQANIHIENLISGTNLPFWK